jgi:hypothetical protein
MLWSVTGIKLWTITGGRILEKELANFSFPN